MTRIAFRLQAHLNRVLQLKQQLVEQLKVVNDVIEKKVFYKQVLQILLFW